MNKMILLFVLSLLFIGFVIPQTNTTSNKVDSSSINFNKSEIKEKPVVKTFLGKIPKEIYVGFYGLIISIITSFITVKLSTKKFRTENWWQLKSQTYSKIFEALHHMKIFFSENFEDELDIINLSDDRKQELDKKWWEGYELFTLEVDKGAFIISKKASEILDNTLLGLKENYDNLNWVEYLDNGYGNINECLEKIRIEAKKDLNIK